MWQFLTDLKPILGGKKGVGALFLWGLKVGGSEAWAERPVEGHGEGQRAAEGDFQLSCLELSLQWGCGPRWGLAQSLGPQLAFPWGVDHIILPTPTSPGPHANGSSMLPRLSCPMWAPPGLSAPSRGRRGRARRLHVKIGMAASVWVVPSSLFSSECGAQHL